MSKQTAVEYLEVNLHYLHSTKWQYIVEQAKEMEKQQIIDARQDGRNVCFRKGERKQITNEDYYNETFNK